jgi:hypothetical protein
MKLDLVGPMVGASYQRFVTRFEGGGPHGSDEQWEARETRI